MLRPKIIEEYDIDLVTHEEKPKSAIAVPRSAKVVVVLQDFTSKTVQKSALKLGLHVALIGRKRSSWARGFKTAGFAAKPQNQWLHVIKASEEKEQLPLAFEPMEESYPDVMVEPLDQEEETLPMRTIPSAAVEVVELPGPPLDKTINRWSKEDIDIVIRLAKESSSGEELVEKVEKVTGVYRTAGTLCNLLRYNPREDFGDVLKSLGRITSRINKQRKAYLKAEKEAAIDALPPKISLKKAVDLLGNTSRIVDIPKSYDRNIQTWLVNRDDVLARRAGYIEQYGDDFLSKKVLYTLKVTTEEQQNMIFDALDEGPKRLSDLKSRVEGAEYRWREVLENLTKSGLIMKAKVGAHWYYARPEDFPKIQAMQPTAPAPKPVRTPAKIAPTPTVQELDPVMKYAMDNLWADIRSAKISFAEGMARMKMLREDL
jgi:hypothetical protein